MKIIFLFLVLQVTSHSTANALDQSLFVKEVVEPNRAYNSRLSLINSSYYDLIGFAKEAEKDTDLIASRKNYFALYQRFAQLKKQLAHAISQESPVKASEDKVFPRAISPNTYTFIEQDRLATELLKDSEIVIPYRQALLSLGQHINDLLTYATDTAPLSSAIKYSSIPKLTLQAGIDRRRFLDSSRGCDLYLENVRGFLKSLEFVTTRASQQETVQSWQSWLKSSDKSFFEIYNQGGDPSDTFTRKVSYPAVWLKGMHAIASFAEMGFVSKKLNPQQKYPLNPNITTTLNKFFIEFGRWTGDYLGAPEAASITESLQKSYDELVQALNNEIALIDKLAPFDAPLTNPLLLNAACNSQTCQSHIEALRTIENKINATRRLLILAQERFNNRLSELATAADKYYAKLPANYEAIGAYFLHNGMTP